MTFKKPTYLCLIYLVVSQTIGAAQSIYPLQSGKWIKFSVESSGVYKIDYNLLKSSGIDADNIDPRNLSVYGNGGGMLPQSLAETRNNDLKELAIMVSGENDGAFNQSDFILFYAEGPDLLYLDQQKEIFHYENHLYADKNFYYVTVGSNAGKRIGSSENIVGAFPIVQTFNDFIFHETEKYNELKSGRKWFGEQFDVNPTLSLKFDIPGITPNTSLTVVSSVMAQSFTPASFALALNGTELLKQEMTSITNTQYGLKGTVRSDTITVNSSSAGLSNITQEFKYNFTKGNSGKSIGYLDYLLASFERDLSLYGSQTIFRSIHSINNPVTTYEVGNLDNSSTIWDITDHFNVNNQQFQLNASNGSFSVSGEVLKTFIAFNPLNVQPAKFEGDVRNQSLATQSSPQLLIVTHPMFEGEARRLANHRQSTYGITTLVVTTEEIYNEFSGGKQDPTAIRDFSKKLFDGGNLENILLFGRCSYDYKNRINNNTNLVPTYESRNSLSPLETYSSDDFFGFLEDNEGSWNESPAENHSLDVGVGRIPAKKIEEAVNAVDKLIHYDISSKAKGPWQKQILFVADDGDGNLHQSDADKLAKNIESNHFQFDTKKIYLDAYKQVSRPSGQISPDARQALIKNLDAGVVIVNFTGHGSEKVWLQEQILDEDLIENEWDNDLVFPLMVTATCEFGRHDDPAQISSSELALIKKNSGAIGFVTAARPVNASTNAFLNNAFYEALFTRKNGKFRNLGSIFRDTKNNSINGVANRNFSLLGDPSMILAIPDNEAVATKVKTANGSDTLKALSRVMVEGEVQFNGVKRSDFNGSVLVTLKDKEFTLNTLGDENPVFAYKERNNTLFRGEASVIDGSFMSEFILPKNIAYQVGEGKLSFYARDKNTNTEAIGGSINFKIGESEPDDESDSTPPEIKLCVGDSTFINGGIASSSTLLFARLSDSSGINVANYGIGNSIVAILDESQTFEVNEYYISDLDDFTKGTIRFPIEGLSPGKHTLELKAWDVYNNGTSVIINFVVTKDDGLAIENLNNYPNPFSLSTTIQFSHNRSGEDLEVELTIMDVSGKPINKLSYTVYNSPYLVSLEQWDGTTANGTKLDTGIYLLRVAVRSLMDGSKNERISKLILVN